MKWEATGLKNPLARARGLGAAHDGVSGWIRLRVTAISNVLLGIWFVWFVKKIVGLPHAEFVALLSQPVNAIAMLLLTISMFYHATLGCREIIEDYFHIEWMKITKLVGLYLFMFAAAVACIFSIFKGIPCRYI